MKSRVSSYRPLEERFNGDAFTFQLVARQGDVALFAKAKPDHAVPKFEVVLIQRHDEKQWPDGRRTPARESMPAPSEWGQWGWTPATWSAALDRFKAKVYDQRSQDQPITWLWPDDRHVGPPREWVLDRHKWEAANGPPANFVAASAPPEPITGPV